MANVITRTVTTYKATAYELTMVDGIAKATELGSVEYIATKPDVTAARKAFKANGIKLKRGCSIKSEVVSTMTYGMSIDQFMAYAKPIATA